MAPSDQPSLFSGRLRLLTPGLLLMITLVAFEGMAISTVMPAAVRDLHGLSLYAWGFSAFFTASLFANVLAGVWADARGPGGPLFAGMGVFVAGLVLAGAAPSMAVFVAGRAVQGLGGGGLIVGLYVVIAREYAEEVRPRMFAWISAAWVLPSLLGPFLGGLIAERLEWRWVFFGLVPLVIPGALLLAPRLRSGRDTVRKVVDGRARALSAFAVSGGVTLLLYGAQNPEGPRLAAGPAGVVLLLLGLSRLLPPGALRLGRGLPTVVVLRGLAPAAFFGVNAFIPLTLTTLHGFSSALAGLALTAGSLGWSVGAWAQGRPELPMGRNRLVLGGIVLLAVAILGATSATLSSVTGWVVVPAWTAAGVGMGLSMSSMNVLVMELSPAEEQGANAAAVGICDTLGASVATGLCGAIVATYGTSHLAPGLATGGLLMAAVAGLSAVAAVRRLSA